MYSTIQAVCSSGGQMAKKWLSVILTTVTSTLLVSSATATPAIPPDGEFYDHAAVTRCQEATEEYFGWQGQVEWETGAALAFWNEYRSVQMVTTRGLHPEGIVWGDCAISDTGSIVVYDFAPGPYNPSVEPPELMTPLDNDIPEDL